MAKVIPRFLVVQERPNPSTAFFIEPFCQRHALTPEFYQLDSLPELAENEQVELLFVRYISKVWQQWVQQHKSQISAIHFFMDDDLFDLSAMRGLPWHYRLKLFRLAWRKQCWLRQQQAKIWVSTPYLQQKYHSWQPQLMLPCYPLPKQPQLTVFYHGSASHMAEIHWLKPVIAEVLQRNSHISFEIIGTEAVNRLFRTLPRVHVLHPMGWPAYQALLSRGNRAIGLAPLTVRPFNQARSHTKFFDITCAGAVGIYAADPVYQQVVADQKNGLLLPMEQALWVEAILALAAAPEKRTAMLQQALITVSDAAG